MKIFHMAEGLWPLRDVEAATDLLLDPGLGHYAVLGLFLPLLPAAAAAVRVTRFLPHVSRAPRPVDVPLVSLQMLLPLEVLAALVTPEGSLRLLAQVVHLNIAVLVKVSFYIMIESFLGILCHTN